MGGFNRLSGWEDGKAGTGINVLDLLCVWKKLILIGGWRSLDGGRLVEGCWIGDVLEE